jgi:NitT/TauT family transport system ATP-binding protein
MTGPLPFCSRYFARIFMPSPSSASEKTSPAFSLRNLELRFNGAERAVCQNLCLDVVQGEFLSIVGPSGCGKSTLLKMLAGLLMPTGGELIRCSTSAQSSRRIGFVFQHPTLLPWRTAADNLKLPLELGPDAGSRQLSQTECEELLLQVGLTAADADKRPSELSGGMQMRLSLARALATGPDILLLDEPFAAVDDLLRLRLQEDVRRLYEQKNLTTILVTHNLHEAVFMSDRVIVLGGSPSRVVDTISVSGPSARTAEFRQSSAFFDDLRLVTASLFRTPVSGKEVEHA